MRRERLGGLSKLDAPPDLWLAGIAARQHGVVTVAQLETAGLTRGAVSQRVRAGRLHSVHRGVYAVGHGRLSREGRWMAAILAAGEGAVLAGLSAAVLWDVWRRRVHGVDILVPARRLSRPGVRVRTCRTLDRRDFTVRDGIPVTTVARMLVDLTEDLDAPRLANVIHEAAFRKRFDERAARAAMDRAAGRQRLGVLAEALALHAGGSAGTRSALEDRFLALVRAAGLPAPLVNRTVGNFEVDFRWKDVCVEVDGDGHARPRSRRADRDRDAALRASGYTVLRFAAADIDERPHAVLAALRRAA